MAKLMVTNKVSTGQTLNAETINRLNYHIDNTNDMINYLVKFLVIKGVIEEEKEFYDFVESVKVAEKLQEQPEQDLHTPVNYDYWSTQIGIIEKEYGPNYVNTMLTSSKENK